MFAIGSRKLALAAKLYLNSSEFIRWVFHMTKELILASGSSIRQELLRNAGLDFRVQAAFVDEVMIRDSLLAENAPPRDIADTLAEMKAVKVSDKNPDSMVIGCDQVLSFDQTLLSKPATQDEARQQLLQLRGKRHELISAVVICEEGKPVWRHIGIVRLSMRRFSEDYMNGYVDRNWQSIRHSVGAYKLEEEGIRLFTQIEGDYFTVLGLPLLECLSYLGLRGIIDQ